MFWTQRTVGYLFTLSAIMPAVKIYDLLYRTLLFKKTARGEKLYAHWAKIIHPPRGGTE